MKFLSQINVNTEYTLPIVDGTNGQVLATDGNGNVYWGSISVGATNLDGLTDVILTSPSSGQLLRYGIPPGSGETSPVWYNFTPNYLTPSSSIDNLGDVTITSATSGQILQYNGTAWVNTTLSTVEYVSKVQHIVKAGVAITKGQAVYVTSSDGTNMVVGLASNTSEAASSKVMGLAASNAAINDQIFVVTEGLLAGLNTSTATAGDPVWLGANGNLIFGLLNKPVSPLHLVYIGVVTRVQQNNGEIFVKVQNGIEIDEIHDVQISSPATGQLLRRDSDGYWKNWTPNFLVPSNVSGTTNYISKFTGANTVGNSQIFDNGTNVGIGTTSPTYKLQVNGDSYVGGNLTSTGYGFFNGEGLGTSIRVGGIYGNLGLYVASTYDMQFDLGWDGVFKFTRGNTERMRITSAGNVGIGTAAPNYKLDVNGSINIYSGNSLRWGSGDVEILNSGYSMLFSTYTGSALTEKMRITAAGNVGIGTTSPANTLQIGSVGATGYSGNRLAVGDGTNVVALHPGAVSYLTANGDIVVGAGGNTTNQVYVKSGGNVGIGTTSPNAKLDVSGAANATSFSSTALFIANADTSGSLQPDQGSPANKIYSFRWQGGEQGYIDTDAKITFAGFKTPTGTASQFLKANGTVDSSVYITSAALSGYATQAWVNSNFYNQSQIDDFFGGAEPISGYNKSNWDAAYNDKVNSASFNTTNGILTLTQQDGGTVTVDLDGRYLTSDTDAQTLTWDGVSKTLGITNGNDVILSELATEDFVTSQGYVTSSHTHTIANVTGLQTALDGKMPYYHTAIGGDPGTAINGVTRIYPTANGPIGAGHFTVFTALQDSVNYGWQFTSVGNDAYFRSKDTTWGGWKTIATQSWVQAQGYITGYTETDTLATVTARGSSTTGSITVNGYLTVAGGADLYLKAGTGSSDSGDIVFQDGTGAELHRLWSGTNTLNYRTNAGTTYQMIHTGNIGSQSVNYATSAGDSTNLGGLSSARYVKQDYYNTGYNWDTIGAASTDTAIVLRVESSASNPPASDVYNWSLWQQGTKLRGSQIAVSAYGEPRMFFRGADGDNNVYAAWNEIIHSGNIASQTIGYASQALQVIGQSGQNYSSDNRTISPSEISPGYLQFGFTSWTNNNGAPYADYLHMRSYTDSSGGSDNLVMFKKSGIGMRIWQQTFGSSTAYSSYADVWTTDNFSSTDVSNWNAAYNDKVNSASFNTTNGVLTLTQQDGGTVTVDLDGRYLTSDTDAQTLTWNGVSKTLGITNGNDVILSELATEDYVLSQGFVTSVANLAIQTIGGDSSTFNLDTVSGQHGFVRFSTGTWGGTNPYPGNYSHVLSINQSTVNGNRTVQMYMGDVPGALFWRMNQGGTLHPWERIWTAANDGADSGLNADLLDGNHASAFALASHTHTIANVTGLQTALDGKLSTSGRAADSELLDGIDESRFVYGNSNTRRGTNLISNWNQTDYPDVAFLSAENGGTNAPSSDYTYGLQYSFHRSGAAYRTQIVTSLYGDSNIWVRNSRDSDVWTSWKSLVHSGNIGSQSVNYASSAGSSTNLYGPAGSYIKMSASGTSYQYNYQVRENDGGYNNTNEIYAPQLAFHWAGVVASSIMMEASGRIAIRNNPGTGYEAFVAGIIYSSGYGNSTQWSAAYGWGNHADAPYWNVSSTDPKDVESTLVTFRHDVTILGTLTESSSIRFKENITPLEPSLGKVNQLEAVSYNKVGMDNREIGLIAEDVAELFPEVVTYNEEGQPQGIQYQRLSVILLKAVQELSQEVNELKKKLN